LRTYRFFLAAAIILMMIIITGCNLSHFLKSQSSSDEQPESVPYIAPAEEGDQQPSPAAASSGPAGDNSESTTSPDGTQPLNDSTFSEQDAPNNSAIVASGDDRNAQESNSIELTGDSDLELLDESESGRDPDLALNGANPAIPQKAPPQPPQSILDEALDICQLAQDFWQKGELEKALETLDSAYALIIDVDSSTDPKVMQQKEDLRFLISRRILEIYASRNIVVNGRHNAIPLEMNRHVQLEMDRMLRRSAKKSFIEAYRRSGRYRPYIVKALEEAGLPEELSWIPMIESSFKVKALSRARALGLWQFISSTGYKFGLKRNQYIDERMDPIKSTDAAIAYMKELHSIFGDWATVIAAYNCGEARVLRVIRTQNVNYLDNFWDLYQRLPVETARHVPKFIAALHIISDPLKYGIDPKDLDPPMEYETLETNRQVHLKDVAKSIAVPLGKLKELNPQLRYSILPPDRYSLRIPVGKSDLLLAQIESLPLSSPPQRAYVWHRVRSGETLSTIARRYRTSVKSIMRANNMRRSNYIVAGKKIKIPQRGYMVAKSSRAPSKKIPKNGIHLVKSGDSLWIIAKRYGTTTKKIQELNNLYSTMLHGGQRLKIPGYHPDTKSSDGDATNRYYVRRGDSPYTIAKRHRMNLEHFLRINNLTKRSKIFPGQVVTVE
jgi:membrane-bound lytic murein transglycosylase D